ncbi:hypothetical protein [Sporosarcina globispora]|uniref:hypothetical protein n=1 Tax=Sporosarcina globispora TaxID=1459 RepID=UPI00128EAE6E|nr:hypothetical protein [Sporosarcina globispora]
MNTASAFGFNTFWQSFAARINPSKKKNPSQNHLGRNYDGGFTLRWYIFISCICPWLADYYRV